MYISGLSIVEDYFYEDYLKTRHSLKLSWDKRSISITHKENPIILVSSKKHTPLVETIYNELSLEALLDESIQNSFIFFSSFIIKKYRHLFK